MLTSAIPYFLKDFTNVYPLIFRGDHTYGLYGISFCLLAISLLISKRFILLGFILQVYILIQSAWGIWFIIISLISLIFTYKHFSRENFTNFLKGLIFGLPITILSLSNFNMGLPLSTRHDSRQDSVNSLWGSYVNFWDYHRSLDFDFKSLYLNSLFFIIILIFVLVIKLNFVTKFLTIFYLNSTFLSAILYLLNDYIFKNQIIFLSAIMPGRFFNLNIVLLIFILIASMSKNFVKFHFFLNLFLTLSIIFFYTSPQLAPKISFEPTISSQGDLSNIQKMCESLRGTNDPIVTLGKSSRLVTLECKLPILVDTTQIDFAAYKSDSLFVLREVIDKLYGVNFVDPRISWGTANQIIRPTGSINPKIIKSNWEFRSREHWMQLACEFNFTHIVVDTGIYLNAKVIYEDNFYTIYKFDKKCKVLQTYFEISSNVPTELTPSSNPFQWMTSNGLKIFLFNSSDINQEILITFNLIPNPCQNKHNLNISWENNSKSVLIERNMISQQIYLKIDAKSEKFIVFESSNMMKECRVSNDERNLVTGVSDFAISKF
jgi:hypothetical protein